MDRSKGWLMAATEKSLDEYLKELSIDAGNIWDLTPVEPITYQDYNDSTLAHIPGVTYSITNGGTSNPSYGAMPNVTIGSGINVTTPVWTTTTNNTGGYTFANTQPNNTVHIKGENADLLINDKSLKSWMEKVEERLNILTPNPEMEKEWDDLRRLGERYRKLEKKCKEKSDMWNKLKAMPKPEIK
jgi:hypothetical protein